MVFSWLKEVNRAHKSVANYFLVVEISSLLTVPIRTYVLMRLSYHMESNKDNRVLMLGKKAEGQLKWSWFCLLYDTAHHNNFYKTQLQ